MKKLVILLIVLVSVLPIAAQNNSVIIKGIVSELVTFTPIPNHAVTILSDSSFGFFYYNTVYTDVNGFYADTISINPITPGDSMVFYVQTLDCNNFPHEAMLFVSSTTTFLNHDFQICNSNPGCQANFTYQNLPNLAVQFTDLSVGGNGIYNWNFGDGGYSNLENPLYTYAQPGLYMVSLSIGDSASGCFDMITQSIWVGDSTGSGCQASFIAYPDSTPNTISFFPQCSGQISTFVWNFGDGNVQTITFPASPNVTHTYQASGTYVACLTIYGADSCYDTYCDTININSPAGCQAQFFSYPDTTALWPYTIKFIDTSTGNPTSWIWSFGNGETSNLQNPSHGYAGPGTYNVCLTITSDSCTSTWCTIITVGNTAPCDNYFTYTKSGLMVSFTGLMVNPQSAQYSWNFGDGQNAQGQFVTHTYAASGIYDVSLTTITDSVVCQFTSIQTIFVGDSTSFHPVYGQVFAGQFPLSLGMAMIFSLDTNLNYLPYVSVAMIDSMGTYYFPMVPDGEYVIYAIPFDSSGYLPTYYGDVINWGNATVINLGQPSNPYNIHLVAGNYMIPGSGLINGLITVAGLKSSYLDKMTMLLMNEQGQPLTFNMVTESGGFDFSRLAYGTYFLHAEIAGCSSDNIMVTLSAENPTVQVNLTFAGNKILGIEDQKPVLEAGVIYPNPVSDQANITLKVTESTQVTLEIFSMKGQSVLRIMKQVNQGETKIILPVASLPSGIYTLRIVSADGINITRKLLKSQ